MNEQQTAFAILVNCLISLGVSSGMNETFNKDLWRAAELMGVTKLDLLKTVSFTDKESKP